MSGDVHVQFCEGLGVKFFRPTHPNAQYGLGTMYDDGRGVSQNEAEAVKWFRKAADQGNAASQYNLGVMYASSQDEAEAVKWYRKAADQGYAIAQRELTRLTSNK